MSTENAKITIRNRRVEIKWVTTYTDHILDNYINSNPPDDLNFQQISDLCLKYLFVREKGRIFRGKGIMNGKRYFVFIILTTKFAVVKTCFYYKYEK